VTPEVAALMEEVHEASWQNHGEGTTRLLSTSAASQLPEKVMTLSVLRSVQRFWLPLLEHHVSGQGDDCAIPDPDCAEASHLDEEPSCPKRLALHRAHLLWASQDPPGDAESGGASSSSWSWAVDSSLVPSAYEELVPSVSRQALQQGSVDGFSVVMPLVDLEGVSVASRASDRLGVDSESSPDRSQRHDRGVDLEIVTGSHLGASNLWNTALTHVEMTAGDALVMDNRLWRRLRLHSPAFSGTALLLVFEYRWRDLLRPRLWEIALWSVAAWCARAHRAAWAVHDCSRGCSE